MWPKHWKKYLVYFKKSFERCKSYTILHFRSALPRPMVHSVDSVHQGLSCPCTHCWEIIQNPLRNKLIVHLKVMKSKYIEGQDIILSSSILLLLQCILDYPYLDYLNNKLGSLVFFIPNRCSINHNVNELKCHWLRRVAWMFFHLKQDKCQTNAFVHIHYSLFSYLIGQSIINILYIICW